MTVILFFCRWRYIIKCDALGITSAVGYVTVHYFGGYFRRDRNTCTLIFIPYNKSEIPLRVHQYIMSIVVSPINI